MICSRQTVPPENLVLGWTMPKSTNSRRDRPDRDGHDGPYDTADRDGDVSKKTKRNRREDEDDDEGPTVDEFGRGARRRRRRRENANGDAAASEASSAASAAAAVADNDEDTSPRPTFASMNLKPNLLRGIYGHGFDKPSAIQQRAVRPIVRGRDVIAQSQSGTGKFNPIIRYYCRFVFIMLFACARWVGGKVGKI